MIIAFITGNSADPGEIQHCQITILSVSSIQRANSPLSDLINQVTCMSLRKEWRMPKLNTGLKKFNHWSMYHHHSVKNNFNHNGTGNTRAENKIVACLTK